MDVVTVIVGLIPADAQYKKMLKVFDACKAAGIECPDEINAFFKLDEHRDDYQPPLDGMEISLDNIPGLLMKEGDENECEDGANYDIDISKLPANVKKIRAHVFLC